jgi:hypothetical protein
VPPSRQDGFGQWPGVPPVMPKNTLPRPPIQVPPALPPQRFPGKAPKNNNKVWIIVVCAVIGACLLGFLLLVSSGLLSTPATPAAEAPTAAPVVYATAVPALVDHTVKVPIMADAESGEKDCSDWGTCRNAQTGNFTILTGYENGTISADLGASGYFIRRMFLFFDTSAIPVDAEITSATLSFYAGPFQEGNTFVHVVHSNADYPFTPESYGKAENLTGGGVELKPDQWFSIPLNSDGLNWIQKGSITKLALMHDYDLSNVVPNSGNSVVITRAGAAQNTPYLEISYRSSN